MKRLVALVATAFAAAALATGASADGTATPLFEDEGFGCGVIDRGGAVMLTFDSYMVWRQSGEIYLRCTAQGTAGDTIEKRTDFVCGLGQFGLTTLSKNVVRREGQIVLECWGHRNPGATVAAATSSGYGAG